VKIAFVIYSGMTALDFVGIFDPITRLKTMGVKTELKWDIVSYTPEVVDFAGLTFAPTKIGVSLEGYDMVVIPGGFGSRKLAQDKRFLDWIRTAAHCPLKVSVCTGSLIWGAAGLLQGRKATTHPTAYDLLRPYCAAVTDARVVDEGDVITARGVTSAIDLGLYLCELLAGPDARETIRRQMDYFAGR
jgi:cyclohexyl-isocyanide hydratase